MKRKSIQLTIPEPCSEDWNKMTDTAKGKFCGSCQKNLVDFSVMKDEEIIDWMKSSKGEICGRMRADQMNRNLNVEVVSKNNWRLLPYIFSIFLISSKQVSLAQSKIPQIRVIEAKKDTIVEPNKETSKILKIRGKVIDSLNGEELPGATILLDDSGYGTSADYDGFFTLTVPESYTHQIIKLSIRFIGYKEITVEIDRDFIETNYIFPMEDMILGEGLIVVGGITAPPPKWKFWKRRKHRY